MNAKPEPVSPEPVGPIPVSPVHAAALAAIHAVAFPPDEVWSATAIALHLGLPGGFGLIDPRGGMVLARAIMDEAEILTLAVVPEARRQALGQTLLHAAMAQAASIGVRSMFLEVADHNIAARALYAKCGFVAVGLRQCYYANGDDALVLRATLVATVGSLLIPPGGAAIR